MAYESLIIDNFYHYKTPIPHVTIVNILISLLNNLKVVFSYIKTENFTFEKNL